MTVVSVVTQERYEEAVEGHEGWCQSCLDFSGDCVEPDAEGYACEVCESSHSVCGAEQALIEGLIEVKAEPAAKTVYTQAPTVTGRLSASEPNLQNIPVGTEMGKRVREAFTTPKPAPKPAPKPGREAPDPRTPVLLQINVAALPYNRGLLWGIAQARKMTLDALGEAVKPMSDEELDAVIDHDWTEGYREGLKLVLSQRDYE